MGIINGVLVGDMNMIFIGIFIWGFIGDLNRVYK